MSKFRIIALVEECNLGARIVISNDMPLSEVCKTVFDKIHYTPEPKKDLIVSTDSRWRYATGSNVEDLGEVTDDQVVYISLWDMEI